MADEDQTNATEADEPVDGEKKNKGINKNIIKLAVIGLLLVGISVGGTITALKMFGAKSSMDTEEQPVEEAMPAKQAAIYYPLKPELIVTYQAKGRHRYAQIGITLMFREDEILSAIELHRPMIMNALNMTISGQAYAEIQTAEGKEILRLQCLQELQRLMTEEIGKPGIEQVLFTDFVMQ